MWSTIENRREMSFDWGVDGEDDADYHEGGERE